MPGTLSLATDWHNPQAVAVGAGKVIVGVSVLLDAAGPVFANDKVTFGCQGRGTTGRDGGAGSGGSHDLTENVRGVVGEGCDYIRVTGHAVREYSGEARK